MNAWTEVVDRLDRLEKKIDELTQMLRRRPAAGVPALEPAAKPRQLPDGSWEQWGGEGTGWIPMLGRKSRNGEKP